MNENRGTYITMNTLLDYVSYDNIIRFDTDDIMRVDMIYSINKYINNIQICRLSCKNFGDEITDKIKSVDGVILIKKYIMDLAGGYKDWRCAADSELIYRLRNFYLVNDIPLYLFKRRIHNDSLTNNNDTNFQSSIRKEYRDYIFSKRYTKNDIYINKVINKNIKKY